MFQWLKQIWTGSEPVVFESEFSMAQSVERLRAATRSWSLLPATEESARGTVREDDVSLCRMIPMVNNSFKPYFVGRFGRRNGKVVLSGRFGARWFTKLFLVFWIGFSSFFIVASTLAATRDSRAAFMPLAGFGVLAFGLGIFRLGEWFSRNDPAWLSALISKALSPQAATPAPPMQPRAATGKQAKRWPPTVILVVCGVLVVTAAGMLVSGISGIQAYRGGPGGAVITRYSDPQLRHAIEIYAALALVLALGIYRQKLFAWRMGFVMLASGLVFQGYSLWSSPGAANMHIPVAVFCAFSVVAAAVWSRWWYAQRVHFHD